MSKASSNTIKKTQDEVALKPLFMTAADVAALPAQYRTSVKGDCLSPLVPDGAQIIQPAQGDLVV